MVSPSTVIQIEKVPLAKSDQEEQKVGEEQKDQNQKEKKDQQKRKDRNEEEDDESIQAQWPGLLRVALLLVGLFLAVSVYFTLLDERYKTDKIFLRPLDDFENGPPPHTEYAKMARYLVHKAGEFRVFCNSEVLLNVVKVFVVPG